LTVIAEPLEELEEKGLAAEEENRFRFGDATPAKEPRKNVPRHGDEGEYTVPIQVGK
jgi:hypothetical protein